MLVVALGFGCASKTISEMQRLGDEPAARQLVRVGLVQFQQTVSFRIQGPFMIYSPDLRYQSQGLGDAKWHARVQKMVGPGAEYWLKFATVADRARADEAVRELKRRRIRAELLEASLAGEAGENGSEYHIVVGGSFRSHAEAERKRQSLANRLKLDIFEFAPALPGGSIEIIDGNGKRLFQLASGSKIAAQQFTVYGVPVGAGFHWERKEDRTYRGWLELLIDREGKMTAVNILPIETYLRGVVPSEMHRDFPNEALKAQAIAARSETIVKQAGRRHAKDGFELCATVHCQVYSGSDLESLNTDRAVEETRGLVLMRDGKAASAVYNGVCGGHTENNDAVWDGAPQAHLRGIFDGDGSPDLLQDYLKQPEVLQRWVSQPSPAYCNATATSVPAAMDYTRKYFRWQVEETRANLESSIKKATGESFGQLVDLVPVERGVSGRLRRLRIVGTQKTFDIVKELPIRQALSATTLYSACFTVEKRPEAGGGLPRSFVFTGAGWGHGVGMCQTGAAGMALRGVTAARILQHYFNGTQIGSLY